MQIASVYLREYKEMDVFLLSLIISAAAVGTLVVLIAAYFTFVKKRKVTEDNLEVLIIGAGISGINIAKQLNDIEVKNYTILEQGGGLGGTWYWNKYPGCACDIPAVLYSFSWYHNPAWSKKYPEADEIQEYMVRAAISQNIPAHIQYNKTVDKCEWNEVDGKWKVDTSDGLTYYASVLVNATGLLHQTVFPTFEGDENFKGIKMHTARWDRNVDLTGKKVGVIGTGCSGVQVIPALIEICQQLTLFQRSPAWVFPKGDHANPNDRKSRIFGSFRDWIQRQKLHYDGDWQWQKLTTKNKWYSAGDQTMDIIRGVMESSVENPAIREKIIPKYGATVKRITFSDDYLKVFNKANFKLVTDNIQRLTEQGVETNSGEMVDLDALIYATGFDCFKSAMPFEIIGQHGQSLETLWGRSPRAYKGICVPKMPNYFIMFGPSTTNDRMFMSECASAFVSDAVLKLSRSGKKSMVVKDKLFAEYNKKVKEAVKTKTYNETAGGYYEDGEGFNWLLYPFPLFYYRWQTRKCGVKEFDWK